LHKRLKKLGFFGKLIFWCNVLVAFLLIVSFVLPYLPPKTFSSITLLSLIVSPLIFLNILFALYWLIRLRKQLLLSTIVLVVAYFHFNPFYELSSDGNPDDYSNTLNVLTYNVRLFNAYENKPTEDVLASFSKLLETEKPDVICIQEYYRKSNLNFVNYPYQYIHYRNEKVSLGHAILSKYPLAETGAFNFKDSNNNTLFADVVKNGDTLRVYNMHLQSLGITPSVTYLQEGDKDIIRKKMTETFKQQQSQVEEIVAHRAKVQHPVLLCGDLNNTPFSYTYSLLKKNTNDAFLERGSGLGTTFKFDGYPMRIDYILTSKDLEVITFKTGDESFSDHYPLSTMVGW